MQTRLPNRKSGNKHRSGYLIFFHFIICLFCSTHQVWAQALPFTEHFEDTDFASRGWYDSPAGTLSTIEHIDGSTACFECKFLEGATKCEGGTPGRHLFDETDEIYLSYYIKYSANYTGSNKPYHPHEFHFLTNENDIYVGPAYTHLTTYIEQNEGKPLLGIQDGENISESDIGIDLTAVTENRAVAGCNGDSDGYGDGECYVCGAVHCNGKKWDADTIYFQNAEGAYDKNEWHYIEAYFKLNTIAGDAGQTDGVLKYWYDGALLIDHDDVMFRTGTHPDMKFNQFLIAPYIGDGSPVEQYMWVDDLTIATSRPPATGVDETAHGLGADIFPNPFTSSATFVFDTEPVSEKTLVVFNILGEEVKRVLIPEGQHTITMHRDHLTAGLYLYEISDSAGVWATGRLVIEN